MPTLLVDDQETLVEKLEELAEQQGHEHVSFYTSLEDARKAARQIDFDRYIADYVFEGEEGDGLSFLEEVSEMQPSADLILLTGKPLSERTEERLRRIGGNLIHKSALGKELVGKLFSRESIPDEVARTDDSVDVGELRLRVESLEAVLEDLEPLTDLLIEDILFELQEIADQSKRVMLIGGSMMSAEELRKEVKGKTVIGRELIRLHHELFRRLRG
jgi:DNA-binding response OmpR family regulator